MRKISSAIFAYLTDWKNLLVHAIVGVVLLLVLFIAPLPVYVRLLILIAVVVFNIARTRAERRRVARDL
jgi:hypothetical protein